MKGVKKIFIYFSVLVLIILFPNNFTSADGGVNALFSFVSLNGKTGENEVKLVVNTDGASINHLIFDIVDTSANFFDMDGSGDPVTFPLTGQSVLGTETPFTTVSGDKGYDLASSNPSNTASYTALHFATLIADKNLPTGAGGTLAFDTDTAIYFNAVRKGTFGSSYSVLANAAPSISNAKIDYLDISGSTVQPSASTPVPAGLLTNVSTTATLTYSISDSTDASVQRVAKLYKRLDNGSWSYSSTPTKTMTYARSGSIMSFSYTLSPSEALNFSTYYKIEYIATDDQGASNTNTFYFSTAADNVAPTQVPKAMMTFISDSNTRSDAISQISFLASSDNSAVGNYYLWTKSYLVSKNILNSNGTRHLNLDTNSDGSVSDSEFYTVLRTLVSTNKYLSSLTLAQAGSTPYMVLTGTNVDSFDNNSTSLLSDDVYYVSTSIAQEIFYIAAADVAQTIEGSNVPNFSAFQVVTKFGDVFGAQVDISANSTTYSYMVGDGSLNVWDAVHLYRNAIGRDESYPILMPDMLHTSMYNYPSSLSRSAATLK